LKYKIYKNRHHMDDEGITRQTVKVSNKDIFIKLLYYSIPFVFTSLILSFYHFVDLATIVKVMVNDLKYAVLEAETTISIILTWGSKLNMIVMAIATGLTTSMIPNITRSFVKKDLPDFRQKVNRSIQLLFFIAMPMTIGLSLLAEPIWTVFYGHSDVGTIVFRYSIMVALIGSLSVILNVILNSLNKYKKLFVYTFTGFIIKTVFTVPLMYSFHALGLHASYGAITATIFGYFSSIFLILRFLKVEYQVKYEETFKRIINMILAVIIMSIVIILLQFIIPVSTSNRIIALLLIGFYSIIGSLIYLIMMIKNKLLFQVFGYHFIERILNRLKLNKIINVNKYRK
ncbi:MAG: polysaccharide biosynthesis C-terminal domain-containing protein, partial [Bacilli bacterium]|nr:polysaccharide biosynthesis C-terminal domain-containing protein [Bacilli bacterium]